MNRIDQIFADLRRRGSKGIMPFICGSHPRAGDTARVLPALQRAGACIVEVGFPFSDPIADGPVIAAAMHDVLTTQKATPRGVFAEIRSARDAGCDVGVVAMVSVSIAWRVGVGEMVRLALDSGVDGFIFPDLPLEEGGELLGACRAAGLTASLLIAPTTPADRVAAIARSCTGFVYMLARAGITGESAGLPDVQARVSELRRVTNLPIACGFGISTAEQVRAVVRPGTGTGADAVIVGSALVRRMSEAGRGGGQAASGVDAVHAAEDFVRELATGLTEAAAAA